MARVSLSNAWDETRAIFARDGRLLVAVALALIVLPVAIVGLIVPSDPAEAEGYHSLLQLAAALIGLVSQLALIRLALGPATSVGAAIAHGARRFPALLGAMILVVLAFIALSLPIMLILAGTGAADLTNPGRVMTAAGAGLILLLAVAAIALSARFMLSTAVASAERGGPVAILKRSWSLTGGNYWRLLVLLLLLLIVASVVMAAAGAIGGVLGAIISPDLEPFSVGALVKALFTAAGQGLFTVLSALMVARVYLQLASRAEPVVTVPHSGT